MSPEQIELGLAFLLNESKTTLDFHQLFIHDWSNTINWDYLLQYFETKLTENPDNEYWMCQYDYFIQLFEQIS